MNISDIKEIIKNEPKYRLNQIRKSIFVDLIDDWDMMTGIPKILRKKLKEKVILSIESEVFADKNNETLKALIRLEDGRQIETVLMRHKDGRNTVCVSSQVGCAMACTFCATGRMSLFRSLTTDEIVEQVVLFSRLLKKENKRVSGVVFMGMGEPLVNYDNVLAAVRVMNDVDGLYIGARYISISTCGIIEGIKKLTKEPLQINLAISLHAPNDEVRRQIMPVAKSHTIKELLETVDKYIRVTHRKVMFEYLMIGGINDKNEHARALAKLMKNRLCMVNMIAYNSTGIFKSATKSRMLYFKKILSNAGVSVTIRYKYGREVKGACGQLATKNSDQ